MFALAGTIGYIVDISVLLLCTMVVGPFVGRLFSFSAAVITTWLINRTHTFETHDGIPLSHELSRYFVSCLGGGAVNLISYSALVYILDLTSVWLILAVAFGSLAGMSVNFLLAKHFVFNYSK